MFHFINSKSSENQRFLDVSGDTELEHWANMSRTFIPFRVPYKYMKK